MTMSNKSGARINLDGKKVNTELFIITYGAMTAQLLQDLKDVNQVNERLEQIGYSMGTRLVEDYLSRITMERCQSLRDAAEIVARSGFGTYLGVQPKVANWSDKGDEFSFILADNPLTDFVELPAEYSGLFFSNIIAGAIRGALETAQVQCEVRFISDRLRGDDETEIRVNLVAMLDDEVPPADD